MTIGDNIKRRSAELRISQTALAERTNLSIQRLNNFIHNRRTPDAKTLVSIAQALETTSEALLGVAEGEVASLTNILARVLELEGISPDRAGRIAKTVVAARAIALSQPSAESEVLAKERLAAHAAWLSLQSQ